MDSADTVKVNYSVEGNKFVQDIPISLTDTIGTLFERVKDHIADKKLNVSLYVKLSASKSKPLTAAHFSQTLASAGIKLSHEFTAMATHPGGKYMA